MKNIFVLPTDKNPIKGDLLLRHLWKGTKNECISWWRYNETITFDNVVQYTTLNGSFRDVASSFKVQNIYITSNQEVKDGEYGICLNLVREGFKSHQAVFKMDAEQRQAMEELGGQKKAEVLKVILTTDQDLIKDGVQEIDDEFLDWFVKNPSCEYVETVNVPYFDESGYSYLLIVPKEELKQEIPNPINNIREKVEELRKQETLEEIALKLFPNKSYWIGSGDTSRLYDPNERDRNRWIEGAKWQQEQNKNLYSKEEIMEMFHKLSMHLPLHYEMIVREMFKK